MPCAVCEAAPRFAAPTRGRGKGSTPWSELARLASGLAAAADALAPCQRRQRPIGVLVLLGPACPGHGGDVLLLPVLRLALEGDHTWVPRGEEGGPGLATAAAVRSAAAAATRRGSGLAGAAANVGYCPVPGVGAQSAWAAGALRHGWRSESAGDREARGARGQLACHATAVRSGGRSERAAGAVRRGGALHVRPVVMGPWPLMRPMLGGVRVPSRLAEAGNQNGLSHSR